MTSNTREPRAEQRKAISSEARLCFWTRGVGMLEISQSGLQVLCRSTLNGVRVPVDLCGSFPRCLSDVRVRITFKCQKPWQGMARVPTIFAERKDVLNYVPVIH